MRRRYLRCWRQRIRRLWARLTAWPRRRELQQREREINEQLALHREYGLILNERARCDEEE